MVRHVTKQTTVPCSCEIEIEGNALDLNTAVGVNCRPKAMPRTYLARFFFLNYVLVLTFTWLLWLSQVTTKVKVKVKCSRYRPGVAQRVGRGIALLFHDRGTRRGWVVSSTPWPHFAPGKDPEPIVQEAGWAPGPFWTGGKSRPHRDSIPDRPARSAVAIPTGLPGPPSNCYWSHFWSPDFGANKLKGL